MELVDVDDGPQVTLEEDFSCADKAKTLFVIFVAALAGVDVGLSIFNLGTATASCLDGKTGMDWHVILQTVNIILLIIHLVVCAIPVRHALFLDHPILFLVYCFYSWRHTPEDGFLRNSLRAYHERLQRHHIKQEGSVCTLVGAFFHSSRAAILVNLVFKFEAFSLPIVLDTVLVILFYLHLFLTQCLLCVACRRLKVDITKAVCMSCIFVNTLVFVLPLLTSYLIWQNMNIGIPMCQPNNLTLSHKS